MGFLSGVTSFVKEHSGVIHGFLDVAGFIPICTNLLVKNRELCHNKIQGVIYYGHKYRRINKTFTRRIPAGML